MDKLSYNLSIHKNRESLLIHFDNPQTSLLSQKTHSCCKILDLVHKGISWGNLPSLSVSTGYKCSSKSFPEIRGHPFEIQTSERQFYQKKENKQTNKQKKCGGVDYRGCSLNLFHLPQHNLDPPILL